jgi:hypothetical protein
VEEPLSLKLNGTAVEVQQSIEEYMLRRGLGYRLNLQPIDLLFSKLPAQIFLKSPDLNVA